MNFPVTLRQAVTADAVQLERLAQLDTRALPPGPHLVAELDGRIHAAISLRIGVVVANPFERTAELCDLLRHAAAALREPSEETPGKRIRVRPVPAPA